MIIVSYFLNENGLILTQVYCFKRGRMHCFFSIRKLIPLLLFVPGLSLAASDIGKVRQLVGEVERKAVADSVWKKLHFNEAIYQTYNVRTGVESILGIVFTDGSLINIGENTEVQMSNLFEDNGKGAFRTRLNIKKGYVDFNVKKLKQESTFDFKTGTATASIRGTNGFVGGESDIFYASLETGKLAIQLDKGGSEDSIVAGETIFGTDSLVKIKLASSGKDVLAKKLIQIIKENRDDLAQAVEAIKAFDENFQKESSAASSDVGPAENSFTLNTSSPVEVCDEGLSIEGEYTVSDPKASLVLKVGNLYKSENLARILDGKKHVFSQRVAISDVNKLWNVSEATLTFVANGKESVRTISLKVNKTCSNVNKMRPVIKFLSYDSITCRANVSIDKMKDDVGMLSMVVDGAVATEESITKNGHHVFKLSRGVHDYIFSLKDVARNESSVKKKMGCYPFKKFSVDVHGKNYELLNIPHPPKEMNTDIMKTLQFRIKSPENDPSFLYKVTVKQNGSIILQETKSQIQSLDYQVPIVLIRGAVLRYDIEVVHKSGFIAKAQKVYEVH